jgi:hypothetical protein
MEVTLSALLAGRALPSKKFPGTDFSQRLFSSKAIVWLERLGKPRKNQLPNQQWNQRTSGLLHSALTNNATVCPLF